MFPPTVNDGFAPQRVPLLYSVGRNPPPSPVDFVVWQGLGARGSDRKGLLEAEHRVVVSDRTTPRRLPDDGPGTGGPQPPEQFEQILDFVRQAADDGLRIDSVERDLMRQLLALGYTLLCSFVASQGDGDVGPEVTTPEGDTARRLPEHHDRRYMSIFGELTIPRVVYGTREGQKIEWVPLDERLGLPEGDFSYVLEDWGQRFCLKESFAEAGQSLEMLLGLRLGTRRWSR